MRRLILCVGLCAGTVLLGPRAWPQDLTSNEGGDVTFGGPGSAAGEFLELRDITFDAQGFGYALDGASTVEASGAREGNLRVQKFDAGGKVVGVFALRDAALGGLESALQNPQRLAALGDGTVFVTQPDAGVLQVLAPDGKPRASIAFPDAMAVAALGRGAGERVAVLASRRAVVEGKWQWLGGEEVVVLRPSGEVERRVRLPRKLEDVQDITADEAGNFYVQAAPNAIYKYSPEGKLLKTWGGNPTTRNPDGSEVLHTVAVDPAGNVYTMAWGHPGVVTRFSADGSTVAQRDGQFKWADPWSIHSRYTPLAIDPSGRLWAGATHRFEPSYPHIKTQRAAPAIVRARADFFEAPAKDVRTSPARKVGFRPSLACALPHSIAYEAGRPVPMKIKVAAAKRAVSQVAATWEALDAYGKPVARGQISIALRDGEPAEAAFAFTPPELGPYFVRCAFDSGGQPLGSLGAHVGVATKIPGAQVLGAGVARGGWADSPWQMWSGLPCVRIHPAKDEAGLAETDAQVALAQKSGATFSLQLVDRMGDLTPEHVRRVAQRYRGRAKFYEVCNEPNFSSDPAKYLQGHKMAYAIIKEADPAAQVMGPGTVNLDLEWLKKLYEGGFKEVSDAISLHDYEGHESITPEHWRWKVAQVRAIMAAHGDSQKPLWQTERAIAGVRGGAFLGLSQAIRMTLHRDLLESVGVPSERNAHYYLNQGGFSEVPSYIWSDAGPHPAALALRVRHALTSGAGRKYLGGLDFGATGRSFLMGTRYGNSRGQAVALRNLGTRPTPVDFLVRGGAPSGKLQAFDCWGNPMSVAVTNGRARLTLGQMPTYVILSAAQSLSPAKIDLGRNIGRGLQWKYSAPSKGEASLLSNGVLETFHEGSPSGGTDGAKIWSGDLPLDSSGRIVPQTLDVTLGHTQEISAVVVRGVRADNQFCALLDYDLEYHDGRSWKLIEKVRTPIAPSQEASTPDATHAAWVDDTNLFVHRFAPVRAARLRIVARRASFGFLPDARAKAWGTTIAPKLMLREVEVFASPQAPKPRPSARPQQKSRSST